MELSDSLNEMEHIVIINKSEIVNRTDPIGASETLHHNESISQGEIVYHHLGDQVEENETVQHPGVLRLYNSLKRNTSKSNAVQLLKTERSKRHKGDTEICTSEVPIPISVVTANYPTCE